MKLHFEQTTLVIFFFFAALTLSAWEMVTSAQTQNTPTAQASLVNAGFEDGQPGEVPKGWTLAPSSQQIGYSLSLTDNKPKSGRYCALVKREATTFTQAPGSAWQRLDATPYRGKRIRYRAAVRTVVAGFNSRAQLWLRADRPIRSDGQPSAGFLDNMSDRPITNDEWTTYEIIGDVEDDAQTITLGLLFYGTGQAWLDDVSIEIVGTAEKLIEEPARPLTARGLENVIAFTRLLGYVRYFHPSDEAAKIKWDAFAIQGMRAVENARDAAELAQKLEALFRPIAPTVRISPTDKKPNPVLVPDVTDKLKAVAWHHVGVGLGTAPAYHSERVRKSVKEAAAAAQFPDPVKLFQAVLGGGVACAMPLALLADETGTLPHSPQAKSESTVPQPTRVRYSANDRATRLADVALAWNVFQHFYPYFDVVPNDWPATLKISLQQAAIDADETAFDNTVRRLAAALHDGHGFVSRSGSNPLYSPALIWDWIEGRLIVTDVGSSIQDLAPGDAVITINGKPVAQLLAEKEALISGATPQWIRRRALSELAMGKKDETVTLEIEPFAIPGQRKSVTLKLSAPAQSVVEKRPEKLTEIEPGIWYVNLDKINDDDFNKALPKLEQAKGIVFDLRGYPSSLSPNTIFSHLSDKPLTSAQWHTPEVTRPDHEQMKFIRSGEWNIPPQAPFLKAKKAFITDGRAISYAESCMGIVEHYKLAEIVGSTTAGTNGNVNPLQLPGGYQISWTGMKVLKHDGSQHHGIGIRPTIPVARTRAGVAAGHDELLERAIAAVKQP